MLIDSVFEVPVGLDDVWAALLDVERIAPCLPGASIDEDRGDGEYGGSMRIKLGPVTSTFKGTLRVAEADAGARRAVIEASARDTRGQGAAAATITSTLAPAAAGTRVSVQTDMKLAGTAAQFGRGVVNDVSEKLLAEFASRLAAELQNPAPRAAASIGSDEGDPAGAGARPSFEAGAAASRSSAAADDVLDLTVASRDALLKRAVPALAGLGLLLALAKALTARRGAPARRSPAIVIQGPLLVIRTRPRRWRWR
ncbi:MAG TPA: SRPBCC family protein [Baekduia sp.]|jgi:carbon monoxide dehydrogenase subunit G|nr:SRPBCC family protein [Baekduia sp.]